MLAGLLRLTRRVLSGETTLGHAYHQVMMRLFPSQSQQNDDFDWRRYPRLYKEELKGIERVNTLKARRSDFAYQDGRITQTNAALPPLHPNHHHLYELVLGLRPASVLEAGCGGGDHLSNLQEFDPTIRLYGVDRSEGQMDTLRERHPDLTATLAVVDLTDPTATLPIVDLAYSQAVLMHISESQGRFDIALRSVLRAARQYVVMIENWTEHDFLAHAREAMALDPAWANGTICFASFRGAPEVRAMVLSKSDAPFEVLSNYGALLQGRELRPH